MVIEFREATQQYFLDGIPIPRVTGIIGKFTTPFWHAGLNLKNALEKGQNVHKTIELYANGNLDTENLCPVLQNYLNQFIAFQQATGLKIEETEKIIYHKRLLYAGRLDMIGKIKKRKVLIEIKTGDWHRTYDLQIAGYELAERSHNRKYNQTICLLLTEKGFKIKEVTRKDRYDLFLSALKLYNFLKEV